MHPSCAHASINDPVHMHPSCAHASILCRRIHPVHTHPFCRRCETGRWCSSILRLFGTRFFVDVEGFSRKDLRRSGILRLFEIRCFENAERPVGKDLPALQCIKTVCFVVRSSGSRSSAGAKQCGNLSPIPVGYWGDCLSIAPSVQHFEKECGKFRKNQWLPLSCSRSMPVCLAVLCTSRSPLSS